MKALTMKRLALLLSIFLLGTLAACSSSDNEENSQEDGTTISMIHYFNKELGEPAPLAQLQRLEDYRNDHTDVTVEEEIYSHDNYETKIKTLAAGNELPDVFLVKGSMIDTLVENEQILNLDGFFDDYSDLNEKLVDGVLEPYKYGGSVYGATISGAGMTHVIYYNEDMFKEAGIEQFPQTWDEFIQAIDQIRDSGVTPIALGNKEKWVINSSYLSTLASRYTGTEWFQNIVNYENDAKFTDDVFVDALKAIKTLVDHEAFNGDMNSIANVEQQSMYMNGKAAMFIEGDWAIGNIRNNAPEEILNATKLAFFPVIEGSEFDQNTVSGGGGWAYAINSNVTGEKLEKVKELIYYLVNEEASRLTLANGAIPTIPVNDESIEVDRLTKEAMELMEENKYVPIYDNVLPPALIEVMNTNLQNMLIGEITPEEVAENIQAEYERQQ